MGRRKEPRVRGAEQQGRKKRHRAGEAKGGAAWGGLGGGGAQGAGKGEQGKGGNKEKGCRERGEQRKGGSKGKGKGGSRGAGQGEQLGLALTDAVLLPLGGDPAGHPGGASPSTVPVPPPPGPGRSAMRDNCPQPPECRPPPSGKERSRGEGTRPGAARHRTAPPAGTHLRPLLLLEQPGSRWLQALLEQ